MAQRSINNVLVTLKFNAGTFKIPHTSVKIIDDKAEVTPTALKQGNQRIIHFSKDETTEYTTVEINSKTSEDIRAIVRAIGSDVGSMQLNYGDNIVEPYSEMSLTNKPEFSSGDSDVTLTFAGI